ncbi:energy transducer TonB [Pseudotenacibaculum sp. MALMAid0570]|uniref:energy transducer TonB n=1 Tax=Pseudotenacibaculum sp. MALMAid0570 TaxID=3143938 RepID=UPI0032DFEF0C
MQVKKNPKFNLESYSKLFMQIGLVLALFITYTVIEKKTFERHFGEFADVTMLGPIEIEPPIIKPKEPEVPKAKPQIPTEPKVVDDEEDVVEDILDTTEINEDDAIEIEDIVEEDEPDDDIIEDVPFHVIEDVPVFPGCVGNNEALKDCFNKKMQKHFGKKFNSDLPNELGLSPGKKRITMLFKIDHQGNIVDVRVMAPHPRLEKEAKRIINLLPKMTPGKQRGKPVGVKYTLPMKVLVE